MYWKQTLRGSVCAFALLVLADRTAASPMPSESDSEIATLKLRVQLDVIALQAAEAKQQLENGDSSAAIALIEKSAGMTKTVSLLNDMAMPHLTPVSAALPAPPSAAVQRGQSVPLTVLASTSPPTTAALDKAVQTLDSNTASTQDKTDAQQTVQNSEDNSFPCTSQDDQKSFSVSHWCGDAVTVPIKIQLTHNKDVQGSANLGYFAGYNIVAWNKDFFRTGNTYPGIYVGPFFGATSVPTTSGTSKTMTNSTSGTSTTQMTSTNSTQNAAAGFDYGVGLVVNVGQIGNRNLHLGVFFGHDHTGKENQYSYNERNWLGASFAIPTN